MLKYFLLASLITMATISSLSAGLFSQKPFCSRNESHNPWDLCLYNSVLKNDQAQFIQALRHHASVDLKDRNDNTLLHVALINGNDMGMIKYLLDAGIDVNARNNAGQTSLSLLSQSKKYTLKDQGVLAGLLLSCCVGVVEEFADNNTSPHATLRKRYDKALIKGEFAGNNTLLHVALSEGCDKALINCLLENEADPNVINRLNETPLHTLAQSPYYDDNQQIEIAQDLFNHGAAPCLKVLDKMVGRDISNKSLCKASYGDIRHTPLYEALYNRKYPLAKLFLDKNSPIDSIDSIPLIHGAHTSSLYLLLWSLRTHADQSIFASGSSFDMTSEDINMAKLLIRKGACLDDTKYAPSNKTILSEILKSQSAPCLKLFIQAGILDTLDDLDSSEKEIVFKDIMKVLSSNIYHEDPESICCVKLLVGAGIASYLSKDQKDLLQQFFLKHQSTRENYLLEKEDCGEK